MPTIKLDGHEIPFQPGDTIIRAAYRSGIDIPHYCWHPGLSIAANCRICLVEVLPAAGQRPVQLDILRWDEQTQQYITQQKPKLQPACQMACTEGMEIKSDTSSHVAQARQAVQELLLLNHPVDCPICDQAGECRLQDYWLEHGRNQKRMRDEIIHKPKGVSFGPTIVYDAERCIVCTRCVRFVEEVAKDPVLDKRERGNLSEIVVSPGRQLDNNYTLMTEHVCPVGALTSKDFRFKARVWFLRSARAICQGCATGCNAYLDYDPRSMTVHRYRPRENEAVNQYWMCDVGMLSYARVQQDRITHARVGGQLATVEQALAEIRRRFAGATVNSTAVILSAQHCNEDNFALATLAKTYLGVEIFFVSGKPQGTGDGILYHPDKNPNSKGVSELVPASALKAMDDLMQELSVKRYTHVLALGAEASVDPETMGCFSGLQGMVTIAAHEGVLAARAHVILPACTWAEMDGTYVNAKGMAQRSERAITPRGESRPGWEWLSVIAKNLGFAMSFTRLQEVRRAMSSESNASVPASISASTSASSV